jgi:hypothetical protein
MPTWKNLTSDLRLGIRLLFLQPVKKLLAEPGMVTFGRNFFGEGLVPTSMEERARLKEASRCIGCGRCDAAPGGGPAPSLLATTFSKASADLTVLGQDLAAMSPERLAAGEALCPSQVPLRRLHAFLLNRRQTLAAASRSAIYSES